MKKLTPHHNQIIEYLQDGELKCMANGNFYMKDDRTRISELRDMGYVFDDDNPVYCRGECGVNHFSRLLMRRLVAEPTIPLPEAKNALRADFDSQERLWGQNSVAIANFAKSALQKPLFEYFGMPSH